MYVKIVHEADEDECSIFRKDLLETVECLCPDASVHYGRRVRPGPLPIPEEVERVARAAKHEPLHSVGIYEGCSLYVVARELTHDCLSAQVCGVFVAIGGHGRCYSVKTLLFSPLAIPAPFIEVVREVDEDVESRLRCAAPAEMRMQAVALTDAMYYGYSKALFGHDDSPEDGDCQAPPSRKRRAPTVLN